ncbi:hypothetical protein V1525DRAFT_410669 [Lipomyces kononenkoae]|uniref:Uncharacterized protein n=1 Tax=Lipomyces kononenkoae TaxID=34357 RepID=A0ACC3SWP2_LIPKO
MIVLCCLAMGYFLLTIMNAAQRLATAYLDVKNAASRTMGMWARVFSLARGNCGATGLRDLGDLEDIIKLGVHRQRDTIERIWRVYGRFFC